VVKFSHSKPHQVEVGVGNLDRGPNKFSVINHVVLHTSHSRISDIQIGEE